MSTVRTNAIGGGPLQMQGHWRRMRVWAGAHAVDDFYQGLVPAAVPYFVLERHFSYVGASGLALAATLGSALPQLLVGVLADRHRLAWMAPVGVSVAGIGAGLAGLAPAYPLVFMLLLVSGVGVAMFHPPAGRDARLAAGGSATAMSYFADGGSVGFFIAPALVTPALDGLGIGATALFIPPAVLMGFVLLRQAALDKMKTWAAAMILFGVTVTGLGVTSADGVEEQLKAQFRTLNRPIEGLETIEQQLGFFDTLTEPQQREFLESVVDQQPDDAADFGKMVGAWSHGDEKGITASFDKDMKANDIMRTVLLARRNAHWADALVRRLGTPGTQFVAVGAGHLTGTDSVQSMLAKLGYGVQRVQ